MRQFARRRSNCLKMVLVFNERVKKFVYIFQLNVIYKAVQSRRVSFFFWKWIRERLLKVYKGSPPLLAIVYI